MIYKLTVADLAGAFDGLIAPLDSYAMAEWAVQAQLFPFPKLDIDRQFFCLIK